MVHLAIAARSCFSIGIRTKRTLQSSVDFQFLLQALQIKRQIACGLVSLLFFLAQRLSYDSLQLGWHFGVTRHWRRFIFDKRDDDMAGRLTLERHAARHHLAYRK